MKESRRYAITIGVTVAAVLLFVILYWYYEHRPWTRDGQVRANIVGIAPRVDGPVINIPVVDNEVVKRGQLLFEIDPSTFIAAVNNARAQVKQAEAIAVQNKQNLQRQEQLFQTKVVDLADYENAQDQYAAAVAALNAAQAQLVTAELNLSYTRVYAPVDGALTNVVTSPGTFLKSGQQILALIDSNSFWIAAYFKETQVRNIQIGDEAIVTFIGFPFQSVKGVVNSIGWGIFLQDGSTTENLLPLVYQTIDWVRLPQRFPVRVQLLEAPPTPLRMGQTVSVSIRRRRAEGGGRN